MQPVTNPPHPHPGPHASHHPLLRSMGWGPGLLPDPAGLAPPSLPAAHRGVAVLHAGSPTPRDLYLGYPCRPHFLFGCPGPLALTPGSLCLQCS